MKLLFHIHSATLGGSVISGYELALEMERRGHAVDVWSAERGPATERYQGQINILDKKDVDEGAYDLFYGSNYLSLPILANSKIRTVCGIRGDSREYQEKQGVHPWHFEQVACLLFISDMTQQQYSGFRSVPNAVIDNGIVIPTASAFNEFKKQKTIARKTLDLDENKTTVLSIGSFTKNKNHIAFIQAARYRPDLQWVLVGERDYSDTNETEYLKELVREGWSSNVKFFPKELDPDVYYQAADILVIPSIMEGGPRVLLEAAAWGIPSVCSSIGSAANFEDGIDIMITDRSPANIAEKVSCLAKDDLAKAIGGQAFVRAFNLHRLNGIVGDMYEATFVKVIECT